MKYAVGDDPTTLRQAPSPTAPSVRPLAPSFELGEGTDSPDGLWINVNFGSTDRDKGWVLKADCVADDQRESVAEDGFVQRCVTTEWRFNGSPAPSIQPWSVTADFLIARAILETGIKNSGPLIAGSDAVGPLQVASAEWSDFLANGGDLAKGYTPAQRDDPIKQIDGAAWRMHADAKKMSDLKIAAGKASTADPFVPSNLDLLFAYLTDSPAAALAISDAQVAGQSAGTAITDILKGTLSEGQISALLIARSKFFGAAGSPKALGACVSDAEKALNDALQTAFEHIKEYIPEAIASVKQGEGPWFDVAKAELDKNIAEPNPHILDYFQPTDLTPKPTSTTTPWCGAFAAFCMSQSGNPTIAASIPKGSAAAASWKTWGSEISLSGDVPQGAVVVLGHTPNTSGTGHVGFFVEFTPDGSQVRLLGGNQSNKVVITPFNKGRVAAVRWMDLSPTTPTEGPAGPPSNLPISPKSINMIVEFEVSSPAVYEKRLRRPEWPGGLSGVTIGIGYDVGFSTAEKLVADWTGLIADSMITALKSACGVTGSRAQSLAQQLKSAVDVPFDKAMNVFQNRDMPLWIGKVQRALENTNQLSQDSLGALVSLAYNRGASFSKAGDRYREMNNIRQLMHDKNFAAIPAQFRSMERIWPTVKGLRDRREREAKLFQDGLA